MRHARRMNSGDDDYEYEEELNKRRERRIAAKGMSRSRENFDSGELQNWYHPSNHHSWSPPEDDETGDRAPVGSRQFERSSYERSTYGPPYEKRESTCLSPYDRKDYKNYDKRKYYRDYARPPGYDFEGYGDGGEISLKDRKMNYYDEYDKRPKSRRDYIDLFDTPSGFSREGRLHKSAKDYFYDREKHSFDRESNESFDSVGRRRRSFGSGDMYGSLDSRDEYRERYTSTEKIRSIRKSGSMKQQRSHDEYDQDSDGNVLSRRGPGDTRSLQRSSGGSRPRKSSGSSPWDGEGWVFFYNLFVCL